VDIWRSRADVYDNEPNINPELIVMEILFDSSYCKCHLKRGRKWESRQWGDFKTLAGENLRTWLMRRFGRREGQSINWMVWAIWFVVGCLSYSRKSISIPLKLINHA
jgi:hypothetical protein